MGLTHARNVGAMLLPNKHLRLLYRLFPAQNNRRTCRCFAFLYLDRSIIGMPVARDSRFLHLLRYRARLGCFVRRGFCVALDSNEQVGVGTVDRDRYRCARQTRASMLFIVRRACQRELYGGDALNRATTTLIN